MLFIGFNMELLQYFDENVNLDMQPMEETGE